MIEKHPYLVVLVMFFLFGLVGYIARGTVDSVPATQVQGPTLTVPVCSAWLGSSDLGYHCVEWK